MPVNLIDLYDAATSDQLTKVKTQSTGTARNPGARGSYPPVNYIEDTFQTEFRSRAYGDKNVTQSPDEDGTNGTFIPRALNYYTEQVVDSKFIQSRGQLVHWYNARNAAGTYSALQSNTPGILTSYRSS